MKPGLLERTLTNLYGPPEKGEFHGRAALLWNPDNWDCAATLYNGMTWNRLRRVAFGPLKRIYGDAVCGSLMGGALMLASLEDKEIGLYTYIEALWNTREVYQARLKDRKIVYFMHEQDVLFYGIKAGRLFVYNAETDAITDLGALEPALEKLASTLEHRTAPAKRRAQTEDKLTGLGIPIFRGLPEIESDHSVELRSAEDVGIRIMCLYCVVGAAFTGAVEPIADYLRANRLWDHLSPNEVEFLTNPIQEEDSMNLGWRVEAMSLLMWAVGLFDELPLPTGQTDNDEVLERLPLDRKDPWPFIHGLELRPKAEILDASDLIYRLHWAVRQARIEGSPPPGGLDPGVVYEWHYAINWLTKYDDEEWDEVSTDT